MISVHNGLVARIATILKGFALTVVIAPAASAQSFIDVPANHWAFEFIEAMLERGITSGCGGDSYCPDDLVTRAQMAVFLIRSMGSPRVTDGNGDNIGSLLGITDDQSEVDVLTPEGYVLR